MAVVFPFSSPDVYQPLGDNEIRLLIVSPGQLDDPVQCTLEQVTLLEDSPPQYETISYCWGDATLRAQMEINGHTADVTFSAHEAIRRMRLQDAQRRLWIDAICINQADLKERGSQITSMGHVYRNGTTNLIHLGGQKDLDTSQVSAALQDIVHRVEQYAACSSLSESQREIFLEYPPLLPMDDPGVSVISREDVRTLHSLYALPWFGRMWVVQETTLAKQNTCYWGNSSFPLAVVLMIATRHSKHLIEVYHSSDSSLRNLRASSCRHYIRANGNEPALSTLGLTALCLDMKVSERRDCIFAIRELFIRPSDSGRGVALLETDYQKPLMHVYRDATRYLLKEHASGRRLLNDIRHRSDSDIHLEGKTSWTFYYDRPHHPPLDPFVLTRSQSGMRDGRISPLRILDSSSLDTLSLEGFAIGTISSTGRVMTTKLLEDYGAVRAVVEAVVIATTSYGAAANLFTAVEAELFGLDDQGRIDALNAFSAHLRSSSSLPCTPEDLPREADDQMRQSSFFFDSFYKTICHRRICHVDTDGIGIGPEIMREGDIVVIFIGADSPHVLRPVKDSQYQFIGAVYVPGLMRGEVFNMGLEGRRFDLI